MNHEYRSVPLASLSESPFNPRRNFNLTALSGLADSIRAQGVLQPLLVRSIGKGDGFEIVAGARRYRAAKMAEVIEVPVRVVDFSNEQALEAAVVENLQRADVHPLEEAQGFKALMELGPGHYDVGVIAEKTGKSKQYIAGRLKLCELIPEAQTEFLAER